MDNLVLEISENYLRIFFLMSDYIDGSVIND